MDVRQLFLDTLADLRHRSSADAKEYDLVQAAGLLRRLLVDGQRLIDQVNREHRMRLAFVVNTPPERSAGATLWARADGLDPETSYRQVPTTLDLAGFLREEVIMTEGHLVTLREAILYLSHVEGGVHAGRPTGPKEEALHRLASDRVFNGYTLASRTIAAAARITSRALDPMRTAVEADLAELDAGTLPSAGPRAPRLPEGSEAEPRPADDRPE